MSFESAAFVPADPEIDLTRVQAWLDGLPNVLRDRIQPDLYLVVDDPSEIGPALAARTADPSVFPPGVVVQLLSDRVIVDPHPWAVPWRAREVVAFLLSLGRWEVTTEYGPLGVVSALEELFPAVEAGR